MKTKYLLFILGIFCCIGIKAVEREIALYDSYGDYKDIWCKDERSITLKPTATIDGNVIRIYSDMMVDNVTIVIKDLFGNIVYSSADETPSRCHIFEIYDLPKGNYRLELEIGDMAFYGIFSI